MLHVQVDMASLNQVFKALDMPRDKSKLILKQALNQTAKEAEKFMYKKAYSEFTMSSSEIKSAMSNKKATAGRLESQVISKSKIKEPKNYKVTGTNKVKIERGGSAKTIQFLNAPDPARPHDHYKAFWVQYKSGHIALAQRIPGQKMKAKKKEAIKSIYSPSVPYQMGAGGGSKSRKRVSILMPEVETLLQKNLELALSRYLGSVT